MSPHRWEIGSLFDLARWEPGGDRGRVPWDEHPCRRFASGRGALVAAIRAAGASRLWMPSYMCQEVVAAVVESGVAVAVYTDGPRDRAPDLDAAVFESGDALLVVNTFGLRGPWQFRRSGVAVIEDHTHAPCSRWALSSTADYCVASLRKLFPLADGGVLWATRAPVPDVSATTARSAASVDKLSGMILKRLYLDGHDVDKPAFRALLDAGENGLWSGSPSPMSELSSRMLDTFPLERWRLRRRASFEAFAEALAGATPATLHRPFDEIDTPFAAVIEVDAAETRDRVHAYACARGVYPSRLWPLDDAGPEVPASHKDLSRRLLVVPIDMRYSPADLARAGEIISAALEGRGP